MHQVYQSLLDGLDKALHALHLSPNSRKIYLADNKRFLSWLATQDPDLQPTTLANADLYQAYLAFLQNNGATESLCRRAVFSLKQLGNVIASLYHLENPTKSLTYDPFLALEKYIKLFLNSLISAQLPTATIKSYKLNIEEFVRWAKKTHPSTPTLSLINKKYLQKYTEYLTKNNLTPTTTLTQKQRSIAQFIAWWESQKDNSIPSDKNQNHAQPVPTPIFKPQITPKMQFTPPLPPFSRRWLQRTFTLSSLLPSLLFFLLTLAFGFFGYRQLSRDQVRFTQAYPSTPVTPNRQLNFQARLENAGGTPINTSKNLVFKLWDSATGGTQLYSSGTCSITPDGDGIFSTQIGGTCGSPIGANVFSENSNVYLEVTVEGEVMTPRQQIATVAYALNSETLQGYPISATISAIKNTVVVMNNSGEIVVGEQGPTLKGVAGTFKLVAPSLSLSTTAGTNGNITLAPDGTGQVNVSGNTTTQNFFNLNNSSLTTGALLTATAANDNTGFTLLNLLSGTTPTSKFSVNAIGLTTIGADLYVNSGISLYNTAVSDGTIEADKFCTGDGETNCVTDFNLVASKWTDAGSYLYPTNGEVLGNSASAGANKIAGLYLASSAPLTLGTNNDTTFSFAGTSLDLSLGNNDLNIDNNTLFVDGSANYVGVGTNTPTATLDVAGTASISGTLAFRGTTDPKIDLLNGENLGIRTSVGGDSGLAEVFTILNNGNVGIGVTNPTTKLQLGGTSPTISNTSGDLILDSNSGSIILAADDDLLPTLGTGSSDIGSTSAPWDNLYLVNLAYPGAGTLTLADNTANAFRIVEGSNVYLDITTTNNTESFSLDLPIGGGTSLTANLFTSNLTKTINLGTGNGADTINIGTGNTTADTINIGGLATTQTNFTGNVNFAGGTTYYVEASGNAKFNDLIAADTANPGLTVGNGTTGYFQVGGSTIFDANGNLTLDSDTNTIAFGSSDTTLLASALNTLTTATSVGWNATTLTLGGNATINGGSNSGGTLTLTSTTHATKGNIQFFSSSNTLDPSGNLTLAGDLRLNGNDILDSAGTTRITLGATTTLTNTTTTLSGTTTLTASSLNTLTTATSVGWNATSLTLGGNATINGGSAANDDLTLQGTSNSTRDTSYVLLQPNGGNVGIGTTTPSYLLHVVSSSTGVYSSSSGDTTSGVIGVNTSNGFGVSGVNNSSGKGVYGNNTSTGIGVYAKNTGTGYALYCEATAANKCGGNQAWFNASDRKLKDDIKPITNALEKVLKLEGVTYYYKNDPFKTPQMGFIAQDVLPYAPEVVSYDTNNDYYGMQTSQLTALLVNAIKEQNNSLKDLSLNDLGDIVLAEDDIDSDTYLVNTSIGPARRLAAFAGLVAGRLKAGLGDFQKLISPKIKTSQLSPLADGETLELLAPTKITPPPSSTEPALVVDGELEAATISARLAILTELRANQIIAEEITASRITAEEIVGLDAKLATFSANLNDEETSSILNYLKERLALLTSNVPNASDIPSPTPENTDLTLPDDSTATDSDLSDNLTTISLDNATITHLTTSTIDSPADLLTLKPTGGKIALANNTLLIDSSGTVTINGNLTISGSLRAETASISELKLGSAPANSGQTALGNLLTIYNEQGEKVSTIDNSGNANFQALTAKIITLASSQTTSADGQLTSNATAGTATLTSPNTTITITSPHITQHSLVYLTPTTPTFGKVLYVAAKNTCESASDPCTPSFTVGIDEPISADISFNWWIIKLQPNP